MTTPPLDLADLEEKARAATPGPWGFIGHPYCEYSIVEKHESDATGTRDIHPIAAVNTVHFRYAGGWYRDWQRTANAAFIAAANPTAILSLLKAHAEALRERDEALAELKSLKNAAREKISQEFDDEQFI